MTKTNTDITNSKINKAVTVESALLKALSIKSNYECYFSYVAFNNLLPETQTILECYEQYYELYAEHVSIEFDTFITQFSNNWHSQDMTHDDVKWFCKAILTIQNADPVDSEIALIGLINKQFIDGIIKKGEKDFNSEDIRELLEKYEVKRAGILQDYDADCCTSADVNFESVDKSLGIPYALEPLQEALGGMVPGSLVVLNAASGIGKSAWVHTQITHTFLHLHKKKLNRPILFFNTEGPISEVFGRFWSCLYKDAVMGGYDDIVKKQDKIKSHFEKKFNTNMFLVFAANHMGLNYIRMKIKKYNPCLVVLDMAAAIMTAVNKNSNDVGNLEANFNGLRKLSSESCPIIATVQAGGGAKWFDKDKHRYRYKSWPSDDDIYGSRTAVQGSAETIITIGRDDDHPSTRYIQTTKKKALKSAKFICELEEKYSCYTFVRNTSSYNGG